MFHQPIVEYVDIFVRGLDSYLDMSVVERLCAAAQVGRLKMSDPKSTFANFQAVIRCLEEERAKLDSALHALTEQAERFRSSAGTGGPPHSPSFSGEFDARSAGANRKPLETPQYYRCKTCRCLVKPGVPHACSDFGREDDCYNGFLQGELDIIHGKGCWREISAPEHPEGKTAESTAPKPDISNQGEEVDFGMRPGSKKYRTFMATKEQLERAGPMHIDAILELVTNCGVFEGVKDRRPYFANLLSQYARKGLLVSAGRGIYDLPRKKSVEGDRV